MVSFTAYFATFQEEFGRSMLMGVVSVAIIGRDEIFLHQHTT